MLGPLHQDARRRLIDTVCTFFDLATVRADLERMPSPHAPIAVERKAPSFQFTEDEPSVKQFLLQKSPTTDVERVACLAFYLARYRATPHFKTKDITAANTEGAQRRFSNAAISVENAAKMGYLVPSIKGSKQLSAIGERFVEALPDRAAAKEEMVKSRARRAPSGTKKPRTKT